ncbi:hypothetical protein PV04_05896 [Phialophora macrospora]|uniref:Secreted protein n=1 Tax=Phialophora macrospora TaxID=1851006 RepID=A0A0D2CN12_9EURO|nr:hypothetical protein PV04_05896 [Phialophora macrospora]
MVNRCSMGHCVAMAVALRCVVCCARVERGARVTSNRGLEAALCCPYSRFTPRRRSEQGVEISRTGHYVRRLRQGRHRILDHCWVLERRVRKTLHRLDAVAHASNTLANSGILLEAEYACSQLRFRDHSQKGWDEENSTCHKMNLGCFITRQPFISLRTTDEPLVPRGCHRSRTAGNYCTISGPCMRRCFGGQNASSDILE